MPRSRPRRTRIRVLATERAELQRRVAARTSTQQDAYRAEIILRVATGQTDAAIAQDMGLAERASVHVCPPVTLERRLRPYARHKKPTPHTNPAHSPTHL